MMTDASSSSGSSTNNLQRIQNIIRRARTADSINYKPKQQQKQDKQQRRRSTTSHGMKGVEVMVPIQENKPKSKAEFVTESMKQMDPHDMIAMLEMYAQQDTDYALEALQGLKNSPAAAPAKSNRRSSTLTKPSPRMGGKEPRNLRASV
ncbi:expressed unknown protein [Seminavis robusta]|uniref:Uncharacterized protein n=1 Tax=Seminavis robusta TaxID=568900 RepID=A0A9N8EB71_9STRA|nr:expressed unknown protein [Seminavis robusta]|eukprot:Sro914_g219550.1 n/a (149) ;mRNA; f:12923-13369